MISGYYSKFSEKRYKELMDSLEEATKGINEICEGDELRVYTSSDVCERLGISEGLLSRYRYDGLLPFSRVGDKYFYIEEYVEQLQAKLHQGA